MPPWEDRTLMNLAAHNLKTIADAVAHALVDTSVEGGSAFISTPLLYPRGSHVVVRMDGAGDRWFVSDDGYGHLEAEMMGGLTTFRRLAKPLADRAGVQFDERCFFVLEVERDALPGAVITISNVSKQAVERTAFAVEERRVAISRDVFQQRTLSRHLIADPLRITSRSSALPARNGTLMSALPPTSASSGCSSSSRRARLPLPQP